MKKNRCIDEATKRNIALNYYKDRGLVLMANDEVHFQGGLAGFHKGVQIDKESGKIKVNFAPSKNMLKSTYEKKFGENK